MKKVKFILPALTNAVLAVLYNYLIYLYNDEIIKLWITYGLVAPYDFVLYIDGREEYHFGMGSFSLLFTVILFIVVVVWTMIAAKKFDNKILANCYRAVNIILALGISIFGFMYYLDWYNFHHFSFF